MAQLGQTFDPATVEPAAAFEMLPEGWYAIQYMSAEWKELASGEGHRLSITYKIDEAQHPELKGRQLFDSLNLNHPKQSVTEMAQRTLSAILRAASIGPCDDTDVLIGIPIAAKVVQTAASGEYKAKNEIKGYDAVSVRLGSAGGSPSTPAAGAPPAPGSAAPTSGKPPWA